MFTLIYTTIDNLEIAEKLASQAVNEKLAACVNIIPNITSIYIWENKTEKSSEYILLFKTSLANEKNLISWLENNHPYNVPAIITFNPNTSTNFLSFIEKNTKPNV